MEGKLTIYDKGFDHDVSADGEYVTRVGGMESPPLSNVEPLRLECEHFVRCVITGKQPQSDGASGLRVVRVLEQLQRSLERSHLSEDVRAS
jgi:predicted dehydrogenase